MRIGEDLSSLRSCLFSQLPEVAASRASGLARLPPELIRSRHDLLLGSVLALMIAPG